VSRRIAWLTWIGVLALYAAIRIPLLPVPLERDEGAFGVVGQAILRGDVPYRDVLDHKPPGVYYLYAAALLVVPPTAAGVHLFLLIWNLATLLCLASLARALSSALAARWTALLFAVVSAAPSVQGFSATTEMLLLLPLVASWRLALTAMRTEGGRRWLVLVTSGALGAAACWLKQPAVLPLLILPLSLLAENGRARAGRGLADLALWLGGGVALSLIIVGGFWRAGCLSEAWYWTVEHNRLYAANPVRDWAQRAALRGGNLLVDAGVPLTVGLVAAVMALRRRRPRAWMAPLFLVLSAAAVAHSWYFYAHYFALLAPAIALVGGLGFAALQERLAASPRWEQPLFVAAALAVIAAPPLLARPWYWLAPHPADVAVRSFGPQGFESAALLADYLRRHTAAADTIFIYGSEPQIAFTAERRLATAFVTAYPLTRSWPRQHEFQERAWSELERNPPAYLVIARLPTSFDRTPDVDPAFDRHLATLGQRAYKGEMLLVYDPAAGAHLTVEYPDSATGAFVQFELWRRTDPASPSQP
jgi:hypothetical protein